MITCMGPARRVGIQLVVISEYGVPSTAPSVGAFRMALSLDGAVERLVKSINPSDWWKSRLEELLSFSISSLLIC